MKIAMHASRFRLAIGLMLGLCLLPSGGWAANAHFKEVMTGMGASAWGDWNNDGWTDLFGGTTYWTNNYPNDPDTPFIQLYSRSGRPRILAGLAHTSNVSLGDYNNDGFIDVYGYAPGESGGGGPKLYTNKAGTGWSNDTAKFLPTTTTAAWVHNATTWVDLNNDGYLDTYVTAWNEPWLGRRDDDLIYTSSGGNTFSHTWSSDPDRFGKGVTHFDFDRDGDQDIYVSNYWQDRNFLWRNDGFDGTNGLTDATQTYGVNDGPGHTQGSAVGDFNNDGEFDIYISNFAHPGNPNSKFMENRGATGNYHFTNRGTGGIAQQEPQDSTTLADFDNDGNLDLFITVSGGYGAERARLLRNNGNWTFTDVTSNYGLDNTRPSNEGAHARAAWGDYDNDGFMDLVADAKLWKNPGSANWPDHHYLKVKLAGGQGQYGLINGSAIGAQVRMNVPGLGTLSRQVEGNTGKGSQNDLTLHFGLGSHSGPVNLEILWPDGTMQTVTDLAVDQVHKLSPTSTSVLKGDVDNDSSVNNLDITPFIAALSAVDEQAFLAQYPGGIYAAADIDMNGRPDNLDITPFIGLLTASDSAVAPVLYPSDGGGLVWDFDEDGATHPPQWGRQRVAVAIDPTIADGIVTIGAPNASHGRKSAGRIFPVTTVKAPDLSEGCTASDCDFDANMDPTQDFAVGFDFKYNSGSTEDGVGPFHVASLEGDSVEIRIVGAEFHGGASNRFDVDLRNADVNPVGTFNLEPDTWGRVTVFWDADHSGPLDPGTFDVWFNDTKITDEEDTVGFAAFNGHSMQLGASVPYTGTISFDNLLIGDSAAGTVSVPEPSSITCIVLAWMLGCKRPVKC